MCLFQFDINLVTRAIQHNVGRPSYCNKYISWPTDVQFQTTTEFSVM